MLLQLLAVLEEPGSANESLSRPADTEVRFLDTD